MNQKWRQAEIVNHMRFIAIAEIFEVFMRRHIGFGVAEAADQGSGDGRAEAARRRRPSGLGARLQSLPLGLETPFRAA